MARAKTKTRTKREKRPVTLADMLALLAGKYTFGPFRDKQIKDMLANEVRGAVAAANAVMAPPVDPLANPPHIFDGGICGFMGRQEQINPHEVCIRLGHVHGHLARIWHMDNGRTTFGWGCARHSNEAEARRHWRDGRSMVSGADRPHAEALLTFVAAICRHRGWTW